MPFGKKLLKNSLFESKTEHHVIEGMMKTCPRHRKLKFLVSYIIFTPSTWVIQQNNNNILGVESTG